MRRRHFSFAPGVVFMAQGKEGLIKPMKFNKTAIETESVKNLHKKYGLDSLEASILTRRGIILGEDILYHIESDRRFMHQSFLLPSMEDAVERINDAIEEGEKVLVFGDRDVDGITSTAIVYSYLKRRGLDVSYRLPVGDDAYGLSIPIIDEFAKADGSLIITVDCGISNVHEIAYAASLQIDVIVTDHHNPPDALPDTPFIIDPKLAASGYPFQDISGAAVAFKLVQALRFSRCEYYAQEFALLDVRKEGGAYVVDCIKVRNLVKIGTFSATFEAGTPVSETKLAEFLRGQQILVWNAPIVKRLLTEVFGTGVEFQILDMRPRIGAALPSLAARELSALKNASKIARYLPAANSEIEGFYNIFVTFTEKQCAASFPLDEKEAMQDLQLVAIAALADIMPMKNENRIFVKNGLAAINSAARRQGLSELLALMDVGGKTITSTDLAWKIIPALNAAGRMGQTETALELLIAEDPFVRDARAKKILELNEQRKAFVAEGERLTAGQAESSLTAYGEKLCAVIDERINRGITGILAAKLMQKYNIPAIAVTFIENAQTAVGSMRSCRGCIATDFLDAFGGIFINHGGHNSAAGFSFEREKLDAFLERLKTAASRIALEEDDETVSVDAELPEAYVTPALLELVERFEPFGAENRELIFVSKKLKIQEAMILGKSERQHLKLVFDCGKYKFPAIFWGAAERLNRDFKLGDRIDVLYTVGKNYYKGMVTPQMTIIDAEKSQ